MTGGVDVRAADFSLSAGAEAVVSAVTASLLDGVFSLGGVFSAVSPDCFTPKPASAACRSARWSFDPISGFLSAFDSAVFFPLSDLSVFLSDESVFCRINRNHLLSNETVF